VLLSSLIEPYLIFSAPGSNSLEISYSTGANHLQNEGTWSVVRVLSVQLMGLAVESKLCASSGNNLTGQVDPKEFTV
jgi:hypothetical protein